MSAWSICFALTLGLFGITWAWWMVPTEWERAATRSPASTGGLLPDSLETLALSFGEVKDEALSETVVTTARIALPLLINRLDLALDVKKRLNERLSSSGFRDRIVPFLINSVSLYEPMGSRVPKTFHEVMSAKLQSLKGVPGLSHALFPTGAAVKIEKKVDKPSGASPLRAKKALVATVLRLYDALYLQTGARVGDGVPKLSSSQLRTVEKNFADILKTLLESEKDNKEVADAIRGILNDEEKQQTIALGIARFVFEFIERHYQVYLAPIRREQALRSWAGKKLEAFIDKKDAELFKFLDWEANRKHYGVHFIVDGLQGNLLEALTGNNPTFLKKIAEEHRKRAQFKPVNEKTKPTPETQTTFLEWVAADPRRLEDPLYLPFFKRLYARSKNSIARNGISTTPTISVRNLPIVMAGADVVGSKRATGVPNFHYVDRNGVDRPDQLARAYYFFGNDAILLPDITRRAGMKTMFERMTEMGLDSISCFTPYDRGATVAFDPFLNLSIGEKVRDFGEVICLSEIFDRANSEADLQRSRKKLLSLLRGYEKSVGVGVIDRLKNYYLDSELKNALKKYVLLSQKGLPTYFQYYFPWPDHFAHFQGPFSDAILSPTGELNRLDHWLSLVQSAYEKANLRSKTEYGMAGDHGLTPVYSTLNPEVEVFHRYETETGRPLKILKISSDEGEGPKVNHPEKPPTVKGYDLVIASTAGGNFMIDAFLDQGANWTRQPVYSELKKWKTLAGNTIDLLEMITSHLPSSLDYLVVRDSQCGPASCDLSLLATRMGKTVRDRIFRRGDRIFYKSSADLLQTREYTPYREVDESEKKMHSALLEKCQSRAELKSQESWCTAEEWRQLAESTPRPDSVVQLGHLYDSDKAGTINLFPRQGVGYNTKVAGRHAGEHFHEKDAFVGFWGAGSTRIHRIQSIVNGSVAPTLMEWMSPKAAETPGEFGFPIAQ